VPVARGGAGRSLSGMLVNPPGLGTRLSHMK
jgi:hypothetical protein